jgi:hypothetical protein
MQAGRNETQAGGNEIQARRNKIQIRRNEIQMPDPSTNQDLSKRYRTDSAATTSSRRKSSLPLPVSEN